MKLKAKYPPYCFRTTEESAAQMRFNLIDHYGSVVRRFQHVFVHVSAWNITQIVDIEFNHLLERFDVRRHFDVHVAGIF